MIPLSSTMDKRFDCPDGSDEMAEIVENALKQFPSVVESLEQEEEDKEKAVRYKDTILNISSTSVLTFDISKLVFCRYILIN